MLARLLEKIHGLGAYALAGTAILAAFAGWADGSLSAMGAIQTALVALASAAARAGAKNDVAKHEEDAH